MSENEYELIVNVLDKENIQASFKDGSTSSGKVSFDPLRRDTIAIFAEWLSMSKVTHRRELEVLGTHLYEVIFNGTTGIGNFFELCLEEARRAKQRLIVRLSFGVEADELADMPWEYLYYKRTQRFLSTYTAVELVLSRYVSLDQGRPAMEREKSPLRILIVVPKPEDNDLAPMEADQVIQEIEKLAGEMAESSAIEIDILGKDKDKEKPTLNIFWERLNKFRPHVLHFIGLGRSTKEKEAEIALLDEDQKSVRWVKDEFIEMFTFVDSIPRLVLLQLCESATTVNNPANFAYLAPRLLNVNVPAVVAMQHPISNKAASAFCKAFYRALAKGESIDTAVQDGRWRITTSIPNAYDTRVFGTPVLYMRGHGGIILRAEGDTGAQTKTAVDDIKPTPKVDLTTSSTFTAVSPKPEQNMQKQSTGNITVPGASESPEYPGQAKPAKSEVNLGITSTSSTVVVESIISAGEATLKEMAQLTMGQKGRMYQKLEKINEQLLPLKERTEMRNSLSVSYFAEEADSEFRKVIEAMVTFANLGV